MSQSEVNHGGNIYEFAHAKSLHPSEVLDFSANINPLGMSHMGYEALTRVLKECEHYPDINNSDMLVALRDRLQLPIEYMLLGNGASELLYAAMQVVPVTKVYVPGPGFSEYTKAAKAYSKSVYTYPLDGLGGLQVHWPLGEGTKENPCLYIVGNPNNPDGSLIHREAFEAYLDAVKKEGSYVLVDESFIEFTDEQQSVRQLCRLHSNLLVLHSLTKFYAVPGLRLGAILGAPELLTRLHHVLPAWSVNRLAQVYGVKALRDFEYIEASKAYIQEEKQRIYKALQKFPFLEVIEPSVNFILLKWLPKSPNLEDFTAYVNRHHIMIRGCQNYEGLGSGWFRIAIKKKEENNVLLSHVKEYGNEHNLFSSTWTD